MLTGDNEATAREIARKAGIAHYQASVLPQDKAAFISRLQAEGRKVAMVGDGINDSAALAQADLSIAMGGGSDIAMDVAKMTIISSDLTKIPEALRLSRLTVRDHPAESVLGVYIQYSRCAHCSRNTLSHQRLPVESDDSRRSHGIQQCQVW